MQLVLRLLALFGLLLSILLSFFGVSRAETVQMGGNVYARVLDSDL